MSDVNSLVVSGRLCAEPELRYTPKGMAIAELRLASNRKRGEKEDNLFVKVTAFDKLAEVLAQHKHTGDSITVTGRLALNSWEKDGVKHQQHYIVANEVTFGQSANRDKGNGADHEDHVVASAKTGSEAAAVAPEDEEIPF